MHCIQGKLMASKCVQMNRFTKEVCSVGFGALAGAGLAAASMVAIEALMPRPADAATVHLQCQMVGKDGNPHQIGFTFNEYEQKTTLTNSNGSVQRFDTAVITGSLISMEEKVSGFLFTAQVDRVTGKAVRTFRGEVMASGTCTKAEPTKRAF